MNILVICLWGQSLAVDAAAAQRWRTGQGARRLYAICLAHGDPPADMGFDRVIRLPLGPEHLGYAEAIGLQLALNEGAAVVGSLRGLSAAAFDEASAHEEHLISGAADLVVVADEDPHLSRLFTATRAAFLASSWAALGGELAPHRQRIASALLDLTGRKGKVYRGAEAGYGPLEPCDATELTPFADALRQRLGLFIGQRRPIRTRPIRRIAVVTPYYKESNEVLRRMMASVAAQTSDCHHIMVSDGFPNALARIPGVTHIELGQAHGDNGNTPRYVGALVALALGYDAVAFLDADNWLEPKHVERLVACQHETGAAAVFSLRNLYLPDGTKFEEDDPLEKERRHVDTSCMLITRSCEFAIHLWGQMPQDCGPLCDRVVYVELTGHRLAWTKNRTLNFTSHYVGSYLAVGRPVPDDVHRVPDSLFAKFDAMSPAFRDRAISRTGRVIRLIGI